MQVQPYLMLNGRCDEAIEFYRKALGAEVLMLSRYKEAPPSPHNPPANAEKIMHTTLKIGESIVMASDGDCSGQPVFQGISLACTVKEVAEAERVFAALSDGGSVQMPLTKTFWSVAFGMLTDRFGIEWMVNVVA